MSTAAHYESEVRSAQARRDDTRRKISQVDARLAEVEDARGEIKRLKERAEGCGDMVSGLDFKDGGEWKGRKREDMEDVHDRREKSAGRYRDDLDDIADDLESEKYRLLDEKHNYGVIIEQLDDAILWLRKQWAMLTN
jgi:predicted  nucleic acid-binding Zn-ribbon protein